LKVAQWTVPSLEHQDFGRGEEGERMSDPGSAVVPYPDSGKVGVINRPPGSAGDEDELAAWFRLEDQVDSWD
jgi:hypothetical protein